MKNIIVFFNKRSISFKSYNILRTRLYISTQIDWVRLRVILPQIAKSTQSECSRLHYFAEKDSLGMVNADLRSLRFVVLGFVCVNLRDQREPYWGFICADWLSTLACYSPADSAEHAEECSKLHYFAEKDRLGWLMLFCCFGVCLRKSARSAGDTGVSSVRIDWVRLRVILPQIAQITQTNAASCIISQRKTGWCG